MFLDLTTQMKTCLLISRATCVAAALTTMTIVTFFLSDMRPRISNVLINGGFWDLKVPSNAVNEYSDVGGGLVRASERVPEYSEAGTFDISQMDYERHKSKAKKPVGITCIYFKAKQRGSQLLKSGNLILPHPGKEKKLTNFKSVLSKSKS